MLYYVLSKAGISRVLTMISNIPLHIFIASVLIYIGCQVISTYRWRLLLMDKYPFWRLFWLYLLGSFFNTFLPGLVGGDAVKAYYLYKESGKGTQAFASVFMDRYLGFASLMIVGIVAYPFGFSYFKGSWIEWTLPLLVLSFFFGSLIVFGFRLGNRFKAMGDFYEYFHTYARNKALIVKIIALSSVIQVVIICAVWMLSRGLGQNLSILPFFIFIPMITTIATLPISIAGIGLREMTFVTFFGFVGLRPEEATALSFAWFLSITAGGLLGVIEYLKIRGK